ncbi:multiple organellar RNA editing factor 2, chloroplastic [Hordeum vulgare]|nr:multiple organellar RNA editing factor 2, chloroplastic [Hordeum vulgare]
MEHNREEFLEQFGGDYGYPDAPRGVDQIMILELRVMAPLFPGCDYEHWLIVMNKPGGEGASKHQMIDCYIQTLAKVLASEEEAKKKIYNVSCERYFGFGCEIDEETSNKLEGIPGVLFVLPDSFVEPEHKDYGGVDFKVKMVNIAGKKLKLAGWDTACQPADTESFEYMLLEKDPDHYRTVFSGPSQISPWIGGAESEAPDQERPLRGRLDRDASPEDAGL